MTIFANDIGILFVVLKTVIRLTVVSRVAFLTSKLCFLSGKYIKLEFDFVFIARFSLEFALSFMSNLVHLICIGLLLC